MKSVQHIIKHISLKKYTLILLLYIMPCNAQTDTNNKIYLSNNTTNSSSKLILKTPKFNFKTAYFDIQLYNPSIGYYENYAITNNNQFIKSDKLMLLFPQINNWVIPLHPFLNTKPDSFNPYGTSNLKTAIGMGIINLFLNKNQFSIQR